ncbi:arylamine N-acetyltransferase [Paenibacillus thermotolerans]|uniref:arylamine N-acetyltransferase n=1 Tax=Paenibacillus thermotolerans TaxID=3027807 RepID=UPI002367CEEF|nr:MULTISPECIES: arylamine N-acetyltransferase [unclassified Paenibacillus]
MDERHQKRYLSCLQTEIRSPTLEYLRLLVTRHLHSIPFENLSKFHYYLHQGTSGFQWLPDLETYLDHIERERLGGNCYILNIHFGRLLASLGFDVEAVRATNGNVHLANKVTAEGRSYYVDVGYGAPLFEPLRPEEQPRFSRRGEEIEIVRLSPDRFMIDRRANGQSIVTKYIEWKTVPLESFEPDITHSLRDEEDNPFMRRIVATLFKPDAAYSVVNQKLFIKTDAGTEIHEYSRKEDWTDMMKMTFGFRHDMLEQALRFIEGRGSRLFTES